MYLFIFEANDNGTYEIIYGWDVVDAIENFHEKMCIHDEIRHVSRETFGLMIKGLMYQDAVKVFNELYPWCKIISIYKNLEDVPLNN